MDQQQICEIDAFDEEEYPHRREECPQHAPVVADDLSVQRVQADPDLLRVLRRILSLEALRDGVEIRFRLADRDARCEPGDDTQEVRAPVGPLQPPSSPASSATGSRACASASGSASTTFSARRICLVRVLALSMVSEALRTCSLIFSTQVP